MSLLLFSLFLLFSALSHSYSLLSHPDLHALLQIKNALRDLRSSNFLSTWDFSAPDPCSSFSGILCTIDPVSGILRVSSLSLGTGFAGSDGLAGTLSPAIATLTHLQTFVAYPGEIAGPIPDSIGRLADLRLICVTNNRVSGPIPDSLANLSLLHTLDLGYNLLHGAVPPDVTALPNLKVVILAGNHLSGEIPAIRSEILHLDLRSNGFSGQIPQLPYSLRYFCASENKLRGALHGLVGLADLQFVDLGMNQLNGTVPGTFFSGSGELSAVYLERNNLSGEIPAISTVGKLSTVDLSHNFFTGKIPPALAGVESVYLNNNYLTGVVPKEYVRSVYAGSMKTLYLQHNYLSEFPLPAGSPLPESAALCLSYNCMEPPVGVEGCPASAGIQRSRPASQCSGFNVSPAPTNG